MIEQTANNFTVENLIDSIRVTIQGRKKYGWFLLSLFPIVFIGFCGFPILGLSLIGVVQKYLPGILQGIVLLAFLVLFIYLLYKKILEAVEYVFDKEVIEINEQSIKIERSGFLNIRIKKVYLAGKIKGLTTSFSVSDQFRFLTHLPFTSNSIGAFMVWHVHGIRPFYNFGRGVSQSDAQNFIETVYRRFPKYRYINPS
jgi:hypothetical protein